MYRRFAFVPLLAALLLTVISMTDRSTEAQTSDAALPSKADIEGVRVGILWWGEWFGGIHTHSRSIELGNSRWHHRLPHRAKIVEDAGRVSRADNKPHELVYKAEGEFTGILIRAAFDPDHEYDPRRQIAVYTSADGEAYKLLEDRSRDSVPGRVGGKRKFWQRMACYNVGGYRGDYAGWNRVHLFSYKHYQFCPAPPEGTKYFKIVLGEGAAHKDSVQLMEVRLYEDAETFIAGETIDPLNDFSKMHRRDDGLVIRSDNKADFKYTDAEIDTQEAFDEELQALIDSGAHYVAFLDPSMKHPNHGWARWYFNSELKDRIKFCIIGAVKQYDWGETLEQQRARWVGYMQHENYLKTPDGRPIFSSQKMDKAAIADLRAKAKAAGLKDPFVIVNHAGEREIRELGADGMGSYGGRLRGYLHPGFDAGKYEGANVPVLPHCDLRMNQFPRAEIDYPHHTDEYRDGKLWIIPETKGPDYNNNVDWFGNELHAAIRWVAGNRQIVPTQAILMYCWDEHVEGGLFAPTKGYGRSYVEKIRSIIDGAEPTPVIEAHWRFDGNAKDTADGGHDTAGMHDGRAVFDVRYVDGRDGKAVQLEGKAVVGVKDAPLQLRDGEKDRSRYFNPNIDQQHAMTMTGWVKLEKMPADGSFVFPWDKNGSYRLGIGHDGTLLAAVGTEANAWYSEGTVVKSDPGAMEADGKWRHLAGVYDGRRVMIYLDGERIAQSEKPIAGRIADSDAPLLFGRSNAEAPGRRLTLDEARLYYGALDPKAIAEQAGRGR